VKIDSVSHNNHRHSFAVVAGGRKFAFPYAKAEVCPSASDPIRELWIDKELGSEAFTYLLASGLEGIVHIEEVLEYNCDPGYMRELLLYQLSVQAQDAMAASKLRKSEVVRRMGTSAAQLRRLLDQTNKQKSVDSMLALLQVLDREVEVSVRPRVLTHQEQGRTQSEV
jgi:hypothetical protein